MKIDREIAEVENQLHSNSLEDVLSCSSSILDTPKGDRAGDEYADDDDFEDGINVTLVSTSGNVLTKDDNKGEDQQDSRNQKKPVKRLNGAAKKRLKYFLNQCHKPEEARILAEKPFRIPCPDPAKRRRDAELNGSTSSDKNPPKKVARLVGRENVTTGKPSSVQQRLVDARAGCSGQSSISKDLAVTSPVSSKSIRKSSEQTGSGDARSTNSYRDVLNSIKLGILPHDYPSTELTTQQLIATQKAILATVAQQRKEKIKPKFGNCLFRPGH